MDKTKKKIKVSAESDSEKSVHLPKFLIKPGTQHRLVSDLANLLLWIFSETSGKMPKWIFVQVSLTSEQALNITNYYHLSSWP